MEYRSRNIRRLGRKAQRKNKINLLQSLFFILLIFGTGFVFLQSSFFSIAKVEVRGVKFLPVEEVVKLTGIPIGVNIFKADLKQAAQKVALNPLVKHVELNRSLPSTVVVDIIERKPVGLLPYQGAFLEIDQDGYYLAEAPVSYQASLPIISGIKIDNVKLGKRVATNLLKGPLDYLAAMKPEILSQVSEINGTDSSNLYIYTLDKVKIKLGDMSRIKEKLVVVEDRLKRKYADQIEYIDVSYDGYPVIKFKEDYQGEQTKLTRPAVDQSNIH